MNRKIRVALRHVARLGVPAAAVAVLVMLLNTPQPASSQEEKPAPAAVSLQESFAAIAERYKPSVVSVTTTRTVRQSLPRYEFFFGDPFEFFNDGDGTVPQGRTPRRRYLERKAEGAGSGVIISEDGCVLTNNHVISDAEDIRVHLPDGPDEGYPAELAGKDPYTDLAVIRIKAGGRKFAAAKLGDSDRLRVGDWVVAIGSPFGLEQTVTAGIVSAKRQALEIEGGRYENMIQTDAAINRGNSGGPLVNIDGEVVGINTAIYAPTGVFSGIGFAVPVNSAKAVIDDLIKKGKVERGWLGVEIKDVDPAIARQFGLKEASGVLVNGVSTGSAAERAGLKRGDVIVSFDGTRVRDAAELQRRVRGAVPGRKIGITVIRDGKETALQVQLGSMPGGAGGTHAAAEGNAATVKWRGIVVTGFTPAVARRYGIDPSEKGVVVTGIEQGRGTIAAGLRPGDLVKGINRRQVSGTDDFTAATEKADPAAGVVFDIVRDGMPLYITYMDR